MHPCALSQEQAADTGHHDPSMKPCSLRAPILSFSPKQTRQNLCLSGRTQASLDLNVFTGKIHLISLMEIWGWNRGNDGSRKSIVSSSACQSGWGRTVPARYKNCVCTTNTGSKQPWKRAAAPACNNFPFNNTVVCPASGAFQDLPEISTSGIISSQPSLLSMTG